MQQTHDDIAFLTIGPSIVVRTHPAASVLKRVFDITVAAVALAVLLPVGLVVASAIMLTSPGRVTFRQRRVGLYGESFRIVKFRTMVRDAEARLQTDPELHAIYLANNHKVPAELDTRVTRLGRFLRSTSLDEIPQFWNVLVGHMSLVGPRPVVPGEVQRYGRYTSVYESVRPGVTGPWQCGGRSDVSYDERVRLDVDYVQNWTLWTDIVILLKTIPAVLRRHGAH
jgi:exopolysaccharide production protein ExoY